MGGRLFDTERLVSEDQPSDSPSSFAALFNVQLPIGKGRSSVPLCVVPGHYKCVSFAVTLMDGCTPSLFLRFRSFLPSFTGSTGWALLRH
jgi:hypothetical protein